MVSMTTATTVCAILASITVAPIRSPRLCATCAAVPGALARC